MQRRSFKSTLHATWAVLRFRVIGFRVIDLGLWGYRFRVIGFRVWGSSREHTFTRFRCDPIRDHSVRPETVYPNARTFVNT